MLTMLWQATAIGAASGFATKKLAKTGGLILGLGFMSVQALVHADILKVNWPKVETLLIGKVDQDGDGKVRIPRDCYYPGRSMKPDTARLTPQLTHKDMQIAAGRLLHNLTTDLPSSAGFAAAFALGFRYG